MELFNAGEIQDFILCVNCMSKEDFEYYKDCAKKDLRDIADNTNLIGLVFDNVFNEKHHIFQVLEREDGQVIQAKIT